jgi:hypothetical protein
MRSDWLSARAGAPCAAAGDAGAGLAGIRASTCSRPDSAGSTPRLATASKALLDSRETPSIRTTWQVHPDESTPTEERTAASHRRSASETRTDSLGTECCEAVEASVCVNIPATAGHDLPAAIGIATT